MRTNVLHDQDRRGQVFREVRDDAKQRFQATGRSSDDDDTVFSVHWGVVSVIG